MIRKAAYKDSAAFIEYIYLPPLEHLKHELVIELCTDINGAITEVMSNQIVHSLLFSSNPTQKESDEIGSSIDDLIERECPLKTKYLKIYENYLYNSTVSSKKKKKKKKGHAVLDNKLSKQNQIDSQLDYGKDITRCSSGNQLIPDIIKEQETKIDAKEELCTFIQLNEDLGGKQNHSQGENNSIKVETNISIKRAATYQKQTGIIKMSPQRSHSLKMNHLFSIDKPEPNDFHLNQTFSPSFLITVPSQSETNELGVFVNDAIIGIVKSIDTYNQDLFPIKLNAINKLEAIIHFCYSPKHIKTHLCIYGSLCTNLCIESSDIDIGLFGLPIICSQDKIEEYNLLQTYLRQYSPFIVTVQAILSAKVPLLKLVINESGVQINIDLVIADGSSNCPVSNGIQCVDIVSKIIGSIPYARETTILIKKLLGIQDFNIPYKGGLSSFSTVMMVAAFIKSTSHQSIHEIVSNFIDFYSNFDFSKYYINSDVAIVPKALESHSLFISHPLDNSWNIASTVYRMSEIQQYLKDVAQKTALDPYYVCNCLANDVHLRKSKAI